MMSKALKLVEAIMQGICNQPMKEDKDVKERTVYVEKQMIDYEKLAEAIVVAERKANEAQKDNQVRQKISVWKSIGYIMKGKSSEDGRYLVGPFAVLAALFFRILAVATFISLLLVDIFAVWNWDWFWAALGNTLIFLIWLMANPVLFLLLFLFLGAANDIENEKDRSIVLSVFSGITSIVAIVIAIIAICLKL